MLAKLQRLKCAACSPSLKCAAECSKNECLVKMDEGTKGKVSSTQRSTDGVWIERIM